jgi:hypothetical protein
MASIGSTRRHSRRSGITSRASCRIVGVPATATATTTTTSTASSGVRFRRVLESSTSAVATGRCSVRSDPRTGSASISRSRRSDLIDVQGFLQSLRRLIHASTRVIIVYYNFAWKPILRLAELAGLKSTEPLQSWLFVAELENVLQLAGFEPVNSGYRNPRARGADTPHGADQHAPLGGSTREPARIDLVRFGEAAARGLDPASRRSHLHRGDPDPQRAREHPCRGRTLPKLGRHTEVIFVEGHSTDGTAPTNSGR